MVPWGEAKVHVMSHALHYGTSVFEGIRCYDSHKGPVVFRHREHMQRLRVTQPKSIVSRFLRALMN